MKERVDHIWHDDWIAGNLERFPSYSSAAKAYREQFRVDICTSALKNHCRFKLGITKPRPANYRHISNEQAEWIKEVYPKVGVRETTKMWNTRYGDHASHTCIKQIAKKCGVTVDPDIAISNKLKAAHGKDSRRAIREPGDTRMECGRLVMKAEDGEWKSAGRVIWEKQYGKIPEGFALVALDGDTTNIDLGNLEIVPWRYLGKLQRNDFFSSDPEITRTGIVWCDLETVLEQCNKKEERV